MKVPDPAPLGSIGIFSGVLYAPDLVDLVFVDVWLPAENGGCVFFTAIAKVQRQSTVRVNNNKVALVFNG